MNVDKLLLVLTMNTIFAIYIAKIELFFNFETKSSLSTSIFIFTTISQILERKFYLFSTQTCRNLLSKSESVKFSLIESVVCVSTDSSVKKYFSLPNQSIFTEIISEI